MAQCLPTRRAADSIAGLGLAQLPPAQLAHQHPQLTKPAGVP